MKYSVREITYSDTKPYLLGIHYAKRMPSISYAFGLFYGEDIVGCVTYGTPPSSPLRNGIAGKEHACNVLELNRLCSKYNLKNEASINKTDWEFKGKGHLYGRTITDELIDVKNRVQSHER